MSDIYAFSKLIVAECSNSRFAEEQKQPSTISFLRSRLFIHLYTFTIVFLPITAHCCCFLKQKKYIRRLTCFSLLDFMTFLPAVNTSPKLQYLKKRMWKLPWTKSESPDSVHPNQGEEDQQEPISIPNTGTGQMAYTPTSPLAISQPRSNPGGGPQHFMMIGNQPPVLPSSPLTKTNGGGIGSMKRRDSFVSNISNTMLSCSTDGTVDFLTCLPYEIAMLVVIHADYPAIKNIAEVSRSWNRFAKDNAVWRRLFLQQPEWRTMRALVSAGYHSNGKRNRGRGRPLEVTTNSGFNSPLLTGNDTPRIGDEDAAVHRPIPSTTAMQNVLSSYSGTSLRPALSLQHMAAPSPTPNMVRGHGGRLVGADWRYLFYQRLQLDQNWERGNTDVHVLNGHADSVYCVQYDHDKIVTGSRDRTIKLWDISTFQCLRTLKGHQASVLCLKYDDTHLVTGSSDSTVIIWNWETGTPEQRLVSHSAGVLDVAFDKDHVVSCSKDCTIKIWHRKTGKLLRTLTGHRGPVNAVQLRANRIVSASGDSLIKMWDLKTGEHLRTFSGHTRGLACVQYDGHTIVSGSSDQTIRVWNAETGECQRTLKGHKDLVRTLHFVGGRRAVSGSYDQTVKVWDIRTGKCTLDLKDTHTSWVFDVQFDASRVVSTSQDQKIIVWDFGNKLDISNIN